MGVVVASLLGTETGSTINYLDSQRAFFVAESGRQRALGKLKLDGDYRATPTTIAEDFGAGSYSVTVSKDQSTYTITSTASVNNATRVVTQTAVATPTAFDYAIFVETNDLLIDNNSSISGDVYCDEDVEVTSNAEVINGLVYADDVSGGGTYTEAPDPPDPVPTFPTFDTTWYDDQIQDAEDSSPSDLSLSGSSTLNLSGNTVYYKKLTVQSNAIIYGPGTIVTTDDIELKDSGLITEDVSIISKKQIKMSNDGEVESGSLVYARDGYILQNDATLEAGNIIVPTSGKQIELKDDTNMTGAIFAYHMKLQNYATITGCIVAHEFESDKIQDDITVVYSEDVLGGIPTGMEAGDATVRPQVDWDESY